MQKVYRATTLSFLLGVKGFPDEEKEDHHQHRCHHLTSSSEAKALSSMLLRSVRNPYKTTAALGFNTATGSLSYATKILLKQQQQEKSGFSFNAKNFFPVLLGLSSRPLMY